MIEGKVWGTTQEILKLPTCSIHRLEIKQGGYCSEHAHRAKFNLFFVESGVLSVRTWVNKPTEIDADQTILRAGDSMIIVPGDAHVFEGVSAVVAYEVYWVELTEDIERRTQGGVRQDPGVIASA